MSVSLFRTSLFALGVVFCVASPIAMAQVTLNLATAAPPQQTDCVATTDANGLTLAGTGTALQATGVTFSGSGCVPPGSGTSNFNAQLTVQQTNPVAGSPSNILWSAGPPATQCVYAGSAPAGAVLAGWPFGSTACQNSSSCSAAHSTAVTPSAAGSYNVSIVCTNASGVAQGSIAASAPPSPPQPANFALTAPATAAPNTPFAVSWAVTGAASCTGYASLPTGSVTLPGWTDVTSPTSPRSNVTASQAGIYTLKLICSNTAGSATSQNATVLVGTAQACNGPAGFTRQTTGSVSYINNGGTATRDLTSYSAIWGHLNANDSAAPWPGRQASAPIITMGRNSYIAAAFTVPANVSPTLSGWIARATYSYGFDVTAAISTTCGDFNPPVRCITYGVITDFPHWQVNSAGNQCPLPPGNYFLNIKATNPAQTDYCVAGAPMCPMATTQNLGN